jgi:hypothetical protein
VLRILGEHRLQLEPCFVDAALQPVTHCLHETLVVRHVLILRGMKRIITSAATARQDDRHEPL